MRHRKAGVKLNRTASHREAMFRNMVTSLFKHERIRTTDVKAKELSRWADHVITLAKRGDLHARRQAMAIVREKEIVHKLFEEAGKRFGNLKGGYTRIVKIGRRPGDAAPISLIELVASAEVGKKRKKKTTPVPEKKADATQPAVKAQEAAPEPAAVAGPTEQADQSAGHTPQEAADEGEGSEQANQQAQTPTSPDMETKVDVQDQDTAEQDAAKDETERPKKQADSEEKSE